MRSGHKGKASKSGKRRALVRRSSSGRPSLGSQRIKGKVVKATVVKANLTKKTKSPKHAVSAFFHFITHERALAKKQKAKLLPVGNSWMDGFDALKCHNPINVATQFN